MRLGIIAVLLFFLVQTGMRTLQVVNFYVQQDRIEELFCINKGKPKLQSHGKCHLAKQIKQEEKKSLPVKQIFESEVSFVVDQPVQQEWPAGVPSSELNGAPYMEPISGFVGMKLIQPPDEIVAD